MEANLETNTEQYRCRTPIVFILYKRVETTRKVLEQIAKVKPPKIYLVADGPRNEKEKEKTDKCRQLAEFSIDWDCEIVKLYSDINLGCCNRIYSGISYALQREEQVIVLEDDTVPSTSFFRFQDEMLEKYKDDERVFSISGFNDFDCLPCNDSYYFVKWFLCWGWGTWARAWKHVDIEMSDFKKMLGHRNYLQVSQMDKKLGRINYQSFKKVYKGLIDSWASRVLFGFTEHQKYSVMPKRSLICNVGYGADATHTTGKLWESSKIKAAELDFPLKTPKAIVVNEDWMKKWIREYHKDFYWKQIKYYVKEWINYPFYRFFKRQLKIDRSGTLPKVRLKKVLVRKPDRKMIEKLLQTDI